MCLAENWFKISNNQKAYFKKLVNLFFYGQFIWLQKLQMIFPRTRLKYLHVNLYTKDAYVDRLLKITNQVNLYFTLITRKLCHEVKLPAIKIIM